MGSSTSSRKPSGTTPPGQVRVYPSSTTLPCQLFVCLCPLPTCRLLGGRGMPALLTQHAQHQHLTGTSSCELNLNNDNYAKDGE